jgi:hypothetical protein
LKQFVSSVALAWGEMAINVNKKYIADDCFDFIEPFYDLPPFLPRTISPKSGLRCRKPQVGDEAINTVAYGVEGG